MSYILEALKRAHADRKTEAAVARAGRRPAAMAASRPLWPWLVGGALVLNALVGAVVFVVTRGSSPGDAPSPIMAEQAPAVAEAPAVASPGPARSLGHSRPTPPSSETTPAPPPAPQRRPAPVEKAEVPHPIAPTQSSVSTQAMVPAPPGNRESPARPQPEANVVAPPASPQAITLQGMASKLKIEVLVWGDNPKNRMVFLNGRKYVEGQALTGGAVIERIDEDGIMLVHEGERVRVRVEMK